jgi:FemAB-related protein (PEP-CTERM system-associated)
MSNNVNILRLTDFDDPKWNNYVLNHDAGTHFHLSQWAKVSVAAGGWEPHYLFAELDGNICGVLPLVHVRSRFGRGALVSTPFCVAGGVVSDNASIRESLEVAASDLAHDLDVAHLEIRQSTNPNPKWSTSDLYFTFKKALLSNEEENFAAIPRKQRAMVRKGIKAGLTADSARDLETFYGLFNVGMRNLGTPVYSRNLFVALNREFDSSLDILLVKHRGEPIAGVLSFYYRGCVLPYYAGGTPAARSVAGFDFMYWALMRAAIVKECDSFDFGRSMRASGAYSFKKNWGFEPQALNYQYEVIHGKHMPVKDPNSGIYKMLTSIWRHLPLAVASRVGPVVSRQLY